MESSSSRHTPASSPATQQVSVSLRGADVAPVKRTFTEQLAILAILLEERGHRLRVDISARRFVLENVMGTLYAKVLAFSQDRMETVTLMLNQFYEEYRSTPSAEMLFFAQRRYAELEFFARKCGLTDVRERPKPRRVGRDLASAFDGMEPEVDEEEAG